MRPETGGNFVSVMSKYLMPHASCLTFLCEFSSINGAEKSLLAMLRFFSQTEILPQVVAPDEGPFAETLRSRGIALIPRPRNFAVMPLDEKRCQLEKILRHNRPDLVHANSLSMGRLSGPVLQTLKIPGVAHLRDIVRLNKTVIADLNKQHRLFAVSNATRDFHVQQGIDSAKCVTLYNGIDLQEFRPRSATGSLHAELGIPASSRLLGCIGQIGLRKGQDVLLDAIEPILTPLDLHLLIIGQRFSEKEEAVLFENRLRKCAQLPPFAERVHFLGIRNDIPKLLPELTLLVHAARQEPLGRVLLESLACGVAAIATEVGGTSEILPCREQLTPQIGRAHV